jgi:hypothetical protein
MKSWRKIINFIKSSFCTGHVWEEKSKYIDGWGDYHFWFKCKNCGGDRK